MSGEEQSGLVDKLATALGAEFGMTGEQILQHMAIGDVPHPEAPDTDCGATDPRDDRKWCRLEPNHVGEGHNGHAPPPPYRTWRAWEEAGAPGRTS